MAGAASEIYALVPGNRDAACALLRHYALPTEDVGRAEVELLCCGPADAPRALIGLETYGTHGLLRSLAVAPAWRGHGLGQRLVTALEQRAAMHGINTLWLLTETARDFFLALGYSEVDRASAPPAIAASAEFSTLCPASAVCLQRHL